MDREIYWIELQHLLCWWMIWVFLIKVLLVCL